MNKKNITLTITKLKEEITRAFFYGQGNGIMIEVGLERDEAEDYVNNRMKSLLKQNKDESNK